MINLKRKWEMLHVRQLIGIAAAVSMLGVPAAHAWEPTKSIEFVVTAGAGGGTDNFARVVQSAITKNKLLDEAIIVTNKGGGSGAEGYIYARGAAGDPHKVIFGTNNAYLLPYVANVAFKMSDLTPVAAMALDEFLLWVNAGSEYKTAKDYIAAAKAKPETLKMGGSQSKDTDQTLVSLIESATGAKFIYVPFNGGGLAAVQLAGGHIDSNTNNPNENIGQWKAGQVRPLCVFSPTRLPEGPKVTGDMGWSDIPLCKDEGIPIDSFQMPRTIWLPANVPADAVAFYTELFKKVSETPEWKEYVTRTVQTARFMSGDELAKFIADDEAKNKQVFEKEGWLVK
jgi:tripartite-type tricarboxylate transporter receptor subunit TctC